MKKYLITEEELSDIRDFILVHNALNDEYGWPKIIEDIKSRVANSEPERKGEPCKQCSGTGIVEVLSLGKACRQVVCKCQINAMKGERG